MAKFNEDTWAGRCLAVLAGYGVIKATISFDGGGDSGQINDVTIEGLVEDSTKVPITAEHAAEFGGVLSSVMPVNVTPPPPTVHDLLEVIGWQALEDSNYDWVNNDGGYGEIELIPGEGRFFVDMNIRETTSSNFPIDMSVEIERD